MERIQSPLTVFFTDGRAAGSGGTDQGARRSMHPREVVGGFVGPACRLLRDKVQTFQHPSKKIQTIFVHSFFQSF